MKQMFIEVVAVALSLLFWLPAAGQSQEVSRAEPAVAESQWASQPVVAESQVSRTSHAAAAESQASTASEPAAAESQASTASQPPAGQSAQSAERSNLTGATPLVGMRPSHPDSSEASVFSPVKYWIFFADRARYQDAARIGVAPEALARRARRGVAVPASIDYPVSPRYLDVLRRLGVQPMVESRWLNAVSAQLTHEQYRAVRELDFVASLRPVGRAVPARESQRIGNEQASRSVQEHAFRASPARGPLALDYGESEEQLALVNAIVPLEAGINGSGVRLGFLDASYSDFDHVSLDHLQLEERLLTEDFAPEQDGWHGLSVVSVAAGYAPGELVGPGHGAHVLGATTEYGPSETNAEEDYFVEGLEWLESMGADVVNASIGYTTFDEGERSYTPEDLDGDTGVTTRAADRAASLGIVFVAAAGNNGCFAPSSCWYYVGTPADGDSVVAVGGVTQSRTRSTFSSLGPTADGRTKPDVAALGSGVYIAIPGDEYAFSGGTSFAAPMVAGIAAQMLQANPALRPMEVADILQQTASQGDTPDNALGWGIVNAEAAVQIAINLGSEQPSGPSIAATRAYPNPATEYVFIDISAPGIRRPDVRLYDVLGRRMDLSEAGIRYPSRDLISLSTANLPQGVYFYTIEIDDILASGRFVVVR